MRILPASDNSGFNGLISLANTQEQRQQRAVPTMPIKKAAKPELRRL